MTDDYSQPTIPPLERRQPHGRVRTLRYTSISSPGQQQGAASSVLEMIIETPNGIGERYAPNDKFGPRNDALAFLAFFGKRPSDLDEQGEIDLTDEHHYVPLVYVAQDNEYGIDKSVLAKGKQDLADADWNMWDEDDIAVDQFQ